MVYKWKCKSLSNFEGSLLIKTARQWLGRNEVGVSRGWSKVTKYQTTHLYNSYQSAHKSGWLKDFFRTLTMALWIWWTHVMKIQPFWTYINLRYLRNLLYSTLDCHGICPHNSESSCQSSKMYLVNRFTKHTTTIESNVFSLKPSIIFETK